MADVTQAESVLLAHAALTHPGSKVSDAAISVTGDIGAMVYLNHANVEVTANATGVSYLVELNAESSNDEHWHTVDEIVTDTVAAVTEALTATEPVGEVVLAVASTTGISIDDQIYIINTTLASSEWARVDDVVTDTSVTILYGLTTEQTAAASDIWTQAERHTSYVNLTGVNRLRGSVVHRAATGSNIQDHRNPHQANTGRDHLQPQV